MYRAVKNITLFILLLTAKVAAQENYIITSYTTDDGLPQSSIWAITEDKNGFLWVSTSDGLCRFDGYNFSVYKNNPKDSTSICGNLDHRFYLDKTGVLWIVCSNGISVYNEIRDNFTTVFSYKPQITSDIFNSIFGENEQYIWVGVSYCGIVKVDKHSHKATVIKNIGTVDLSKYTTWTNGFIEKNKLFVCTNRDFFIFDISENKIILSEKDKLYYYIYNINDSTSVICSQSSINIFDKNKFKFTHTPYNLFDKNKEYISDICSFIPEELLFATSAGIFYYDLRLGKIIKSIKSFDNKKKDKYAFAQCLYIDKSKNLWIGTNGAGLKRINYPYKNFLAFSSHNDVSNVVKSVFADSQQVFVGYFNNGMDIFDRKTGFKKNISFKSLSPRGYNNLYGIAPLNQDVLILNFASKNLLGTYKISTGETKLISPQLKRLFPNLPNILTQQPFLMKKRNGSVLVVIGEYIVSLNEPKSDAIEPKIINRFPGETLDCGFEDTNGWLWIGTMNCVYYQENNIWTKIQLPENVTVKSINEDNSNNFWIGTINGIYLLDSSKKIVSYFSEATGLVNQFIYGILKDNEGNMWFSHNKGLSVYDVIKKEFRNYYKEDGLQSSEFNTNAYFKSSDGTLFFGGIEGTNAFNPKEILDNPNIPNVRITSIKLFDLPLILDSAYWKVKSLTLPYNSNSLSFEFAALEFTNPKKNQYAYMLEGLDNTWINSGDRRFARYAALSPGQYSFKVKASNNDGKWQEKPTTIFITIVPPYWQQLWFRILVIMVSIGSATGIIFWIQQQRNKKRMRALELQQKIQLERERISRDLHDTVGTQLSLISNNIEWVANPLKVISDREKGEKLQFVNNTARDVIATLRETIWALNKQQIPLEEFSDKLKAFAQKQFALYPQIELNFKERLDKGVILGPSEALNLFRICQEAIANALKYADASIITIDVQNIGVKYKICISDNGIGFEMNKFDLAIKNGLENMKYRARDIGCNIEIRSEPMKGTRIIISKK